MGERLQALIHASAAALVTAGLLAAVAADAAPRSASDVRRAEQRFESTAAGLRRDLSRRKDLVPEARDPLRDVQFVYRRSVRPEVRSERRFGVAQVIVSDGWMMLAEQLLSAAAMPTPDCALAYVRTVAGIERANRGLAASGQLTGLKAWPMLADHLASGDDPACQGASMHTLRQRQRVDAIAAGLDAALAWMILRQLSELPCTLPPPSVSASAPESAATSSGCPSADADLTALAWARATERDLRAAAPVVLAHFALICSESCTQGLEAYRRYLTETAARPGPRDAPALDLAAWSKALAP
jgi:hypothetical protein